MSKYRLELPEEVAKELSDEVDSLKYGDTIAIVAWGFELVVYRHKDDLIRVYISDTSGG